MLIDKARAQLAQLHADDDALAAQQEALASQREALSLRIDDVRKALLWLEEHEREEPEAPLQGDQDGTAPIADAVQPTAPGAQLRSRNPKRPLLSATPEARFMGFSVKTLEEAFARKSIADAAIALLTLHGSPLNEEQLASGLKAGGVTIIGANPSVNVRLALNRKAKERNSVIALPRGEWGLATWSSADGPAHAGASGAYKDGQTFDHMENARLGLRTAQTRGVKLGRPSVHDEKAKGAALTLLDQGTHIKDVASKLGVHENSIRRWRLQRSAAIKLLKDVTIGTELPEQAH